MGCLVCLVHWSYLRAPAWPFGWLACWQAGRKCNVQVQCSFIILELEGCFGQICVVSIWVRSCCAPHTLIVNSSAVPHDWIEVWTGDVVDHINIVYRDGASLKLEEPHQQQTLGLGSGGVISLSQRILV